MPIMRTRNLVRAGTKTVLLAAVAGAVMGSAGCGLMPGLKPGGPQRSIDEFTYMSTPWEPLTVTLLDRRDQMPLWTVDVPIGSKVSLRFYENRETSGTPYRPDLMRWEIYADDKTRTRLTNAMAVPGAESRMLQVSLRDAVPEFPEEMPDAPAIGEAGPEWVPVQPRRFRGVPTGETPAGGAYYRAD